MAGPVLEEYTMNPSSITDVLGERLVDASEAAHCLNLPMYLLTHPKERQRLGIPHYRVGKLVRFKLQELEGWMLAQGGASNA
jgi:hypothetical protein